jgi:hypothetical protein
MCFRARTSSRCISEALTLLEAAGKIRRETGWSNGHRHDVWVLVAPANQVRIGRSPMLVIHELRELERPGGQRRGLTDSPFAGTTS